MELEFDKEMDAILRKARGGSGVSVTSTHLDADTIAAFVENALPEKARVLNMEHFADCDRCRKQLAFAMSMNSETEPVAAAFAPVVEAAIPWYSRLFRTPNLALAMGALVVAFSGVIGYLAIQNQKQDATNKADVAQADVSKPYATEPAPAISANSANPAAANPSAPTPSATVAANPASPGTQPSTPASGTASLDQPAVPRPNSDGLVGGVSPEKERPEAKPVTEAPSAVSKSGGSPVDTRDDKDEIKSKKDAEMSVADNTRAGNDRGPLREGPSAPKKVGPGTTREAGPLNTQQQSNANIYSQTPLRSVGGKNFDNRGGVWYDTSFNGQPMIRLARGSDEYKKLDGSIKRIAENLGGTVVVVWKAKAYRIQ